MVTFSNCKLNIGLNITSRRDDGYHDIVTCMIPVPWHDVIEIIPVDQKSSLTVLGNHVDCPPEKNLVMKAYYALKERYNLPEVDIILQKIVPDGAGLGGGSSDAAHTLLALDNLFELGIPKAELCEIATTIGADCPFFIHNRPMICTGIGEIMQPVNLPLTGHTIVIAKPSGVCISTKEAYSGVHPHLPAVSLQQLLQLPVDQWQGRIINDFEASIFPIAPQIEELKLRIIDLGAVYASMSGSGASVYGIFDNDILADKASMSLSHLPHFSFKVL